MQPRKDKVLIKVKDRQKAIVVQSEDTQHKVLEVVEIGPDVSKDLKKGDLVKVSPQNLIAFSEKGENYILASDEDIVAKE
jgi:co-chaperonin GroES (HSP10)